MHSTGAIASVKIGGSFVSTVTNWNVTEATSSPNTVVSSNSKQGTLASHGVKSWSGGFTYCGLSCPFIPGKKYTFSGYSGPTGSSRNSGIIKTGDVIITGLSTTIDWNTNAPITWAVTFQGVDALTTSTGAAIDSTTPQIVTPQQGTVTVAKSSGSAVTTSSWELSQITFNITAAISGGVATSNSNGWAKYTGGAINWTAGYTFANDDYSSLGLEVGDDISTTISFGNAGSLAFKWTRINELGDVSFDNSSAEPVTQTVNGVMNAYSGSYGEVTIGSTVIWPTLETDDDDEDDDNDETT